MKSSDYWKGRFALIEQSMNGHGINTYYQLETAFYQAQKALQDDIDNWMVRVAENNKVSLQDAKKLLNAKELAEFKWSVQDYIKYGEENALNKQWMRQLENASARFHISRLEALKIQTQNTLEKVFGNELTVIDEMARRVYSDDYYHTAFELQRGFNIGWDVSKVDERRLNTLISKPWAADGKNFSGRIWERKTSMINQLHNELVKTCIMGKSPDEAIRRMTKFVNGKFENARTAASRLVMTEQAFFASAGQQDCFNDLGVEEFEIVATLDFKTSDICQSMDGQHFSMKDYAAGITAPPFHPWCRSTTCPYFNDEFSLGERAARDENGKTYYVPSNVKYPDWKQAFVDGGSKTTFKPLVTVSQNAITNYLSGKKYHEEQVAKLAELEREVDKAMDKYMEMMDTPEAKKFEAIFDAKFDEAERQKRLIEDLEMRLKEKESMAIKQVEKNLSELSGMSIDKVKMEGMQYDSADMVYRSYERVLDRYPQLKNNMNYFEHDGVQGRAYASCYALKGGLVTHGSFNNYSRLVKDYANDVKHHFHPVGTDHNSIIVHELGHALDGYMTKQKLFGGEVTKYGVIRTSTGIQKEVLKRLGYQIPDKTPLREQGFTHRQIVDYITEDRKNFITKHVSGYAAENDREFFAECFSEYLMSENPRKVAKIFGELIEEVLK